MKNYLFSIVAVFIVVSIVACKRDDDEPERVRKSISRLYVSTEDYASGSAAADLYNVWALDGVNDEKLPQTFAFKLASAAKGGSMIHFSPFSGGSLFQGSVNSQSSLDTAVHVMEVSKTGVISNRNSIRNRMYDKVRGLFYTVVNDGQLSEDYLLFANASDTTKGTPPNQPAVPDYTLFAIDRPRNKGNFTRPRYRMKLDHNPWGVIGIGNDLVISNAAEKDGGVVIYKGFIPQLLNNGDTIMKAPEKYVLKVADAQNIRGLSYSASADVLLLTDYVQGQANSGKILVFEKFSQYQASQTITPTRIVTGALTKLQEPMDVAIDSKEDGKYFFVADPAASRVFRFLISATGNVAPDAELTVENRRPRSISLDSR
ncbi:hypothetical protein SAMN05660841_00674 [Sphingobacterium nematocida]|uniref:DUF4374 domain-containing protein n=1 Tax=Sphingobacterium nematocida TaxID=1513896 RepID=A0A1T5BHR9_9SPHI|nr:hypothetical protein [Sphingobacterium nematocida]SKB46540.1 hypothetical protein SAMN05660841_00674 [Sphingobacterium nematocida]